MKRVKRVMMSLMTFAIVLSLIVPVESYAANDTVRLATFNIAANKKPDIAKLNELLQENNVDIVGLQEVDKNTSRNSYDMLERFVDQGTYSYSAFQRSIYMTDGVGEYGIGLLSKYEMSAINGGALNSEGIKEARAWVKGEVVINGKKVSVYNTHLTHETQQARSKQLLELKDIMDNDPNEYKVLCGDFNTDQDHNEIYPFLDNYNIANGKDNKWYDTYNGVDSSMKTNAVDNIITTRNIKVENITMVETSLSDHNLFYLDATLSDEEVPSRDLLNQVINQANALDEDKYTEASWNALDEKLVVGELLSLEASQVEINAVVKDIQDAMDELELRYPNLALNKNVSVSGLEVTDGRFTAAMAVDGEVSSTSRVSFAKDKDEQWLVVDLGETKNISYLVLNYESCPPAFKIQVSTDGVQYQDVYSETGLEDGGPTVIKKIDIDAVDARYVKYVQQKRWKHSGNGKLYSGSIYEFEVYEKNPETSNYANLALNKDVDVSGLEVYDGRFAADLAVDGDKTSRVSFAKDKDEQWLLVDLGGRKTVSEFVLNYESCPPAFKIQVSTDGVHYKDVHSETGLANGGPTIVKEISIEPIKAHYVKYVQLQRWKHSGNGKLYSGSIFEFEVYKEKEPVLVQTSQDVLKEIKDSVPEIEGNKLVLPTVPEGFEISLYGCDNKQVVSMDGTVHQPLQDMRVNVLYQVKNLNDEEDVAYSESDISFVVEGIYKADQSINAKPNVMPGLREWKGNEGEFTLTQNSRIVVKDASLNETAKQIQFYLKEMVKKELPIGTGEARDGDIVLVKDNSVSLLGNEGYTLDIADVVTITSSHNTGVLYGGISITQILSQDSGMNSIPKGIARDYPKYEVRSGMLDVARTYIPMDYLREMTIYMAYFKLNEVQVHVNDYWGATGYSAFRLECETYPSITATDGSYSKDEYRQYQIDMRKYGIDVITEIDTPYHAECFRSVPGVKMLKAGALDIRDDYSYEVIENVLDEYLDGKNPVIQSQKFHIGTDEYDKAYSEQMRKWTDHFIKYVNAKGYDTRLWGSLGSKGFKGTTPVSNEATVNLWAPYWADVKETYGAGYDIINTCGGWLYIVPGANAGYPDRLDLKSLYDKFEVNNFAPNRQLGNGTAIMPVAHPQTKGAEFALWNDMTSYGGGFSWFDIYDRFKDAVMIVSEKTWYGEKTAGQTSNEFIERTKALKDVVPGANPGRVVESQDELVTSIDFTNVENDKAIDASKNHYDAQLVNVQVKNQEAVLSGDGYISLPYDSIGYPYTVMINMNLSSDTPANTEIFSGKDGVLYANIDGTGKLGYARGSYQFTFNYELPKDKLVNLTLTCDQKNTTLYIDGKNISVGQNMATAINNRKDSNTFILPTEKILNHAKGSVDSIAVYNRVLTASEISDKLGIISLENLAFHKNVIASSSYPNKPWTPDKLVDGGYDGDSRWSSKRATGAGSNEDSGEYGSVAQYVIVDLEKEYLVDKINLKWEGAYATQYAIQGSLDGETYFDIKNITNGQGGDVSFDQLNAKARYIKIDLRAAKNANWGYSLYELEVYGSTRAVLQELVDDIEAKLEDITVGSINGCILEEIYQGYMEVLEEAKELIAQESISDFEYSSMYKKLTAVNETVEENIIFEKETALELYNQKNQYEEKDYTKDSYQSYKDNMNEIYNLIEKASDYKEMNKVKELLEDVDKDLVKLDRSSLLSMIEKAGYYTKDIYTDQSWQNMEKALNNAKSIYDLSSVNQKDVNEACLALEQAIASLTYKDADYSAVDEAMKIAHKLDQALFENFNAVEEAMNAVVKGLDITQQDKVNAMAKAILEAIEGLKEKPVIIDPEPVEPTPTDPTPVEPTPADPQPTVPNRPMQPTRPNEPEANVPIEERPEEDVTDTQDPEEENKAPGETNVEDTQIPQAGVKKTSGTMNIVMIGVCGFILFGGLYLLFIKRKKEQE